MKKESIKEKIENCLFVLDFDTQRMSTGGRESYNELKKIVVDLYNDNIRMIDQIRSYGIENAKNEEKQQT